MIISTIFILVTLICTFGISFWWLLKPEEQKNKFRDDVTKFLQ